MLSIENEIHEAITQRVAEIKERVMKQAVADFEKSIRGAVGQVAIDLSSYYSVENRGSELLIRVKIEGTK